MCPKQVHEGSSDLLYVPKCVLTADTTIPHTKSPPVFFCAALQLLITPPHRATANQVRDPFFFACEGESHLSPAPTPHAGGASSGQTVLRPFNLGTPPVPWAFNVQGVPKAVPPFELLWLEAALASPGKVLVLVLY